MSLRISCRHWTMAAESMGSPGGRVQKRTPRGRTSHTAAKVARGVVFAARDPTYAKLLPDGAARSLEDFAVAAGVLKPWMCRLFESDLYRRKVIGMMTSLWPGEMMRLVLRKRFVDDEVRDAIAAGATQLLIVGAGFDTLGLRIAGDFSAVRVVEIDTPATTGKRMTTIEELGWTRPNHRVVGAELGRQSLGEVLDGQTEWSVDDRTVVVAEGVLMYLCQEDVVAFLSEISAHAGPLSRLVFSYLTADQYGRPYMGRWSGLTRASLKLIGEPLRWCISEGGLERFLRDAEYQLLGPQGRYDFRARYLEATADDQPVGTVERFAVAECGFST